jgi:ribosome-associated heat shock protein Hsp15
LVYARFVKHRAKAQALIEQGAVRVNRVRVEKPAHVVKPQDVLTIVLGRDVRVVKVVGEAERRGSANLAQSLYVDISTGEKQGAQAGPLC